MQHLADALRRARSAAGRSQISHQVSRLGLLNADETSAAAVGPSPPPHSRSWFPGVFSRHWVTVRHHLFSFLGTVSRVDTRRLVLTIRFLEMLHKEFIGRVRMSFHVYIVAEHIPGWAF